MSEVAETVELLVSEIITNSVQASVGLASGQWDGVSSDGVPTVRFWLAADREKVLIQVWDGCHWKPERREPALEAESGRGLQLVEALSSEWGTFVPNGRNGKVVWALVAGTRDQAT